MKKTEIYSNHKKALLFFCLSIIFVVLKIWMILEAENIKTPFLRNPLLKRIAGISGVLFFGFVMFVMAKKLFRKKLMLILDETGIHQKLPKTQFIKQIREINCFFGKQATKNLYRRIHFERDEPCSEKITKMESRC